MSDITYLMSFTAGALLYRESMAVAELYAELGDWAAVREMMIRREPLADANGKCDGAGVSRGQRAAANVDACRVGGLAGWIPTEQGYVLWLAICKRYRFIHDFAVEVVRERVLRLNFSLAYEDFDVFFRTQAEWHPEVESVEPSTRAKLRQVLFRMMREAEILSRQDRILPAILTPQLVTAIRQDAPALLAIFPVSEAELKGWLQ